MRPFLFVWIPRSAGTSIWSACCSAVGEDDAQVVRINSEDASSYAVRGMVAVNPARLAEKSAFDPDKPATTFLHADVSAVLAAGVTTQAWLEQRFVFACIRNPWDRLLSLYRYFQSHGPSLRHHAKTLETFREFVDSVTSGVPPLGSYNYVGFSMANPQTAWLADLRLDFVGRYEQLYYDWGKVASELGLPAKLGHLHATDLAGGNYCKHYDRRMREQVADFYKEDVKTYGYRFGG